MPVIIFNEDGEPEYYETDVDQWVSDASRILLNGPPLTGKTTSLLTFPRPCHILIAPTEMGASSIRDNPKAGVHVYKFQFKAAEVLKYQTIWRGVQETTQMILDGSHGKVNTFCIDGLHRLYYFIQKALGYTASTDSKEYSRYHETFVNFLLPILSSDVPTVVATSYDGTEMVEDSAGKGIATIYPGLPGRMAKEIMGYFPLVFHSETFRTGKGEEYRWQLRAKDKVRGAGAHFPADVRDVFPNYVPQDWNVVLNLINKALKETHEKTARSDKTAKTGNTGKTAATKTGSKTAGKTVAQRKR